MNFQEYHEQNPTVYPRFLKIAIEMHSKGFKRYSAKAILEAVRYFTSVAENGGKFKINNNVTPRKLLNLSRSPKRGTRKLRRRQRRNSTASIQKSRSRPRKIATNRLSPKLRR